jgi:1-deoxy-D-xylulose-5-phosphate reductoisomerase
MAKNISILGSTGSIGIQSLDVARNLKIKVSGLSANSNVDLLEKQAREFMPRIAAINDDSLRSELKSRLKGLPIEVLSGLEGLKAVAAMDEIDTVVTSIVGIAGLIPTLQAIKKGKDIALANKETLVTAGSIIMSEAKKHKVNIFPVDSEHSAIFQCLMGNNLNKVSKLILTASGGPFRGRSCGELMEVSLKDALKHPNWVMGSKITIDSASLMNKGLEVIEAKWLFDISIDKIEVLIHPQSVVHSMVEYCDGSVMAQLGSPDMRIPIQFALTYPDRSNNEFSKLDLLKTRSLTFEEPDLDAFPCLGLAFNALETGGTMPTVLNAANEVAVGLFLEEKIRFIDIPVIIEKAMEKHQKNNNPSLEDIIEVDKDTRDMILHR